jgi:polyferredoxin
MKLSRLRVAFQVFLHAVLIGHVTAYYFLDWKKIGALDFQAFFHYFLCDGLLTAGALLTIAAYGSALIFGRLFCSWGCHFGAWQDLAAWIFRRAGWRPPLLRTRFLHFAPFLVLAAAFGLPLLDRWAARGWGPVRSDLAAVAPWDTLPGWLGSLVTFAACGAGALLFLGTRGFCRFVCPYGALFRVTDLAAGRRVRRVGACSSGCSSSGIPPCTQVCPTAIDVHAETGRAGRVTSVDCVRCNLCIEACPSGALAHTSAATARRRQVRCSSPGTLLPAEPGGTFRPLSIPARPAPVPPAEGRFDPAVDEAGSRYDLPAWGEAVVLLASIGTYAAVDLVYGGHFLAAVLALGQGFLLLTALRAVAGDPGATVLGRPLRRGRGWTLAGITVVGLWAISLVPTFEAAAFKCLRWQGLRLDPSAGAGLDDGGESPRAAREDEPGAPPVRSERLAQAAAKYRLALEYLPSDASTRRLLISAHVRGGDPRAVGEAEELHRRSGDAVSRALLDWVRAKFPELGPGR